MHIHILGICGTFMGGLAVIAKQLGHKVSGSDLNVYPPMSDQLVQQGIELVEGYEPSQLEPTPDLVIVGNALSRGNPCVEAILNRNINFTSGPQWLSECLLKTRWVLAVAGTHGKTTTSAMLAWILEYASLTPGFLIGGIPKNFGVSARLGESPFFVIEADEYDTAFFDKRSKFVHYYPKTLVLNNLEYDHADIFPDLASIEQQFHHLVRLVPAVGKIIRPVTSDALDRVINRGCWSAIETLSLAGQDDGQWQAVLEESDGSCFNIMFGQRLEGTLKWNLNGHHSVFNALAAIAAARHAGVQTDLAIAALSQFEGVKRRMELRGEVGGISVYDDFAHHPTAIASTLAGLRAKLNKGPAQQRIIAVIEPRSNTMRMGIHRDALADSAIAADQVYWYEPESSDWGMSSVVAAATNCAARFSSIDDVVDKIAKQAVIGDFIVVMSNGGFSGIHDKLLAALTHYRT